MNRLSFRTLSIVFLWIVIPIHGWSAQDPHGARGAMDVVSVGRASVAGSNLVRAKEEALNQALRSGAETYLIQHFGRTAMTENFRRIMGELLPQIMGDVENYNILAENRIGDDYYVLVRVGMNDVRVRDKIERAGLGRRDVPALKVLFMVTDLEGGQAHFWWAEPGLYPTMGPVDVALYKVFQERGFRPVNRTLGVPESVVSPGMRDSDLTQTAAAEWGKAFSADLVIHGWVDRQAENVPSLRLKVLRVAGPVEICESAETLRTGGAVEPKASSGGGVETLVAKSADTLIPCMVQAVTQQELGNGHVEIVMEGLKNFQQLRELKRFLVSELEGVKSVVETRMKYRSVSLSVVFSGDRKGLLRQILGREITSLPFDLVQAGEDKIVLKVR